MIEGELMYQINQTMQKDYKRFPFTLKNESCKSFLSKAYMKEAGIDTLDGYAEEHISQMVDWLTSSDKWGVMLMGSVGNGKTTMMNATVCLLQTAYANSKSKDGMKMTSKTFNEPAKNITNAARKGQDLYEGWITICAIDDLGEEPKEVLNYGNAVTPVVDILEDRYRKREITLITTNLDADGIREKYGIRVADRLREMMMIIPFTNPSYR